MSFLMVPRTLVTTGTVVVLTPHIRSTSISKSLYLLLKAFRWFDWCADVEGYIHVKESLWFSVSTISGLLATMVVSVSTDMSYSVMLSFSTSCFPACHRVIVWKIFRVRGSWRSRCKAHYRSLLVVDRGGGEVTALGSHFLQGWFCWWGSGFQKFKRMPAPGWAQKMLCINCAQSANSFSWVLFVRSYTTVIISPHLPGSFTKLVRARETFIFYFPNQKRRNYRWVEKTFGMLSAGAIQFAPRIFCFWRITMFRK